MITNSPTLQMHCAMDKLMISLHILKQVLDLELLVDLHLIIFSLSTLRLLSKTSVTFPFCPNSLFLINVKSNYLFTKYNRAQQLNKFTFFTWQNKKIKREWGFLPNFTKTWITICLTFSEKYSVITTYFKLSVWFPTLKCSYLLIYIYLKAIFWFIIIMLAYHRFGLGVCNTGRW